MRYSLSKILFLFFVIALSGFIAWFPADAVQAFEAPAVRDEAYRASFVRQSLPDPITLAPGEKKTIVVTMRNTGTATWTAGGSGRATLYTFEPKYRKSLFADASWKQASMPAYSAAATEPGKTADFAITVRAPEKPGTYHEEFYLAAEDVTWIKGGRVYLDFNVTGPSAVVSQNPEPVVAPVSLPMVPSSASVSTSPSEIVSTTLSFEPRSLVSEPLIRVLVTRVSTTIPVQLDFPYQLYAGEEFKTFINPNTRVVLEYAGQQHIAHLPEGDVATDKPLRLVPVAPQDYFVLPDNERRISGRKYAFNAYRGTLEFRFSSISSTTLVINELPLDWYVAGITETHDAAPTEYIKALLIAARSYAYFHLTHDAQNEKLFDVYSSTVDQLYLGYHAELSMPRVAQMQRETYGQMVTYQGTPVITPYSSRTNGLTRTWKEAWGGTNKPWLVPVEAKYDKGRTRNGHGVGMSNNDAILRAKNDGWNYATLLAHYYTGTNVEKIY